MRMARLSLLSSGLVAALLLSFGCGTPFIEISNDVGFSDADLERNSKDPYIRAWQAMRIVLEEEFGANKVRVSTYPERQWRSLYVHSAVHAQGLTKQRTEVKAYVAADEYNEPVPQIYVWHQMQSENVAKPASNGLVFGRTGAQRLWVRIARNEAMEARLTNRVYEILDGTAGFDTRLGDPHSQVAR